MYTMLLERLAANTQRGRLISVYEKKADVCRHVAWQYVCTSYSKDSKWSQLIGYITSENYDYNPQEHLSTRRQHRNITGYKDGGDDERCR